MMRVLVTLLCLFAALSSARGADPTCATGIKAANYNVCCRTSCGTCAGDGCSGRPGGSTNCCAGSIWPSNKPCALYDPPCIMPPTDPTCLSGLRNSDNSVCCVGSCSICTGNGCSGQEGCCGGTILSSGVSCRSGAPPCIIGPSGGNPLTAADPTCVNGIVSGDYCCLKSCGTCGGDGCSRRDGGSRGCCAGTIELSGRSCMFYPPPCKLLPKPDGLACTAASQCMSGSCYRGKCECTSGASLTGTSRGRTSTCTGFCQLVSTSQNICLKAAGIADQVWDGSKFIPNCMGDAIDDDPDNNLIRCVPGSPGRPCATSKNCNPGSSCSNFRCSKYASGTPLDSNTPILCLSGRVITTCLTPCTPLCICSYKCA